MMDFPLSPICGHWFKKISIAWGFKRKEFQDDADECTSFFDGPYDFLYTSRYMRKSRGFVTDEGDPPKVSFGMTVNKASEIVQLFGPVLYHRNPVRKVIPRLPPEMPAALFGDVNLDPFALQAYLTQQAYTAQGQTVDETRAALLGAYLNYTPFALDLKTESRWAIDEALIKGLGVMVTEVYTPPGGGPKMVGSFFETCDNIVYDSDAETPHDAQFVAIRCCHPIWQVEEEYGLAPGSLKGHVESHGQQAAVEGDPEGGYKRAQGKTNDLCIYFKVYSKMGMGGRLEGATPGLRDTLDLFGDYVYLVIAKDCPYPLNLSPEFLATATPEEVQERVQWPTPFWVDDGWPFTPISFHRRPRKIYPSAILRFGLGELKFINWCYSFIAGKIKTTARDFIAFKKSAGEELKDAILNGKDMTLLELEEAHGTISEVVGFLQHPEFNGDVWKVLEAVEANFEKRVGLTELMYGQSQVQLRSAQEANLKASQLQVRPDDMASKVEEAMTEVARKEMFAAYWHLGREDVRPVLGEVGAYYWEQLIAAAPVEEVVNQLQARVEANSMRKPNQERDAANLNQAMTTLFPSLWAYGMQTTDVGPVNNLIMDWSKAVGLDPGRYIVQPPPPPVMAPAAGGEEEQPPPEGGPPA